MFDRLDEIERAHGELERQLSDPEVLADQGRYAELAKKHAELNEIVTAYNEYRQVTDDLATARELADEYSGDDADLMAQEARQLARRQSQLEGRLRELLLPKDPNDEKDVIVEVRAGTGGDEAGLFAGELVEMYQRYADAHGWKTEVLSLSQQDIGGIKDAVFEVKGRGAYSRLKHESGVHRVQRVPKTESQGRIHTSTATVAVLPAAEEVDLEVDPGDLRIDVYRSSGPGGQSVNTTDSAVRITHLPTGLVVSCQDEKSQHQNRDKAMRILRSRLLQIEQDRQAQERADTRKGQIGTGDRSEKIRTYNFPQDRVTDHRIGLTISNLPRVMMGEIDDLIEGLQAAERMLHLQTEEVG
ncbi:MAG: peptide chain release factor 1 [Actinobacteria bacterium]|nr:peptide chain release factor 1 [Actinomycetota bacterium]